MATGALIVGVLTESAPDERRVALDPSVVRKLVSGGRTVLIESGAGTLADFPDADYAAAGGTLTSGDDVLSRACVIAVVRPPGERIVRQVSSGQVLIGLLDPLTELTTVATLAERGVTMVAFELLPRTLSRAQAMDALSSQASASGYRAAVVAAETFGRYLAMMITASGTATPAKVIVIGAGVAGLQAIATMRRLGAVVTGYDVRAASQREVESLGAQFLTSSAATGAASGDGAGGYARPLTDDERHTQQAELAQALTSFDIIITTARVPGRRPPMLVTEQTLATLKCGSVCIDLGASAQGGNVAGSVPGRTVRTPRGVSVVGAGDLASDLPTSSSAMYARNVLAVITSLAPGQEVVVDPGDEIHQSIVVSHRGEILSAQVRAALAATPLPAEVPPRETTHPRPSLIEAKAS